MPDHPREFGVIGLGRMGGNLALQALEKQMRVLGLSAEGASPELLAAGVVEIRNYAGFREQLTPPRAVFLYIPAGPGIDAVVDALAPQLEPGDIIADGGNSYWGDSIRRARRLLESAGVRYVDLGTSGGVEGARHGACFMAGGEPDAVARLAPMLRELAVPGGFVHAGPCGAGHFAKLVHNGIEVAMLQAIGEGVDLLEQYRDSIDIEGVLACWQNGSVIRGWLIELMHRMYAEHGGMGAIPAYVEDTGEVNWLVSDALRMEVPIPVISQSVIQLLASRDGEKNWARAVAMMRHGFGGHPFGASSDVQKIRRESKVGDFPQDPG